MNVKDMIRTDFASELIEQLETYAQRLYDEGKIDRTTRITIHDKAPSLLGIAISYIDTHLEPNFIEQWELFWWGRATAPSIRWLREDIEWFAYQHRTPFYSHCIAYLGA